MKEKGQNVILVVFLKWKMRSNFPLWKYINKNICLEKKLELCLFRGKITPLKTLQLAVAIALNIFYLKVYGSKGKHRTEWGYIWVESSIACRCLVCATGDKGRPDSISVSLSYLCTNSGKKAALAAVQLVPFPVAEINETWCTMVRATGTNFRAESTINYGDISRIEWMVKENYIHSVIGSYLLQLITFILQKR